jgi:hypothetical protein
MLSGEPLITDEQFERLLANGRKDPDLEMPPVVKIFLPHIRFFLIALDENLDTVLAITDRGGKRAIGFTSLSKIVAARLGGADYGIRPERDKYITLNKSWNYYLHHGDL